MGSCSNERKHSSGALDAVRASESTPYGDAKEIEGKLWFYILDACWKTLVLDFVEVVRWMAPKVGEGEEGEGTNSRWWVATRLPCALLHQPLFHHLHFRVV